MSITYLEAIREAQSVALRDDPRVYLYGQDIGAFGGAFKATKDLAALYPGRVLDSPISEDAMVGSAVGAAMEGMRPVVEMQFADFSSVGFNQIVNQAATLYWRTGVPCPITIRLPAGGNPGSGPFHSQMLEAIYSHFPGLIVMTPATVEDAYSMLLEAIALDDPVIFCEHKYLYNRLKADALPSTNLQTSRWGPIARWCMRPWPLPAKCPGKASNSRWSTFVRSSRSTSTPYWHRLRARAG